MWFAKDNSSNLLEIYCFHGNEFASSFTIHQTYTKADGSFSNTIYDDADFDLTYQLNQANSSISELSGENVVLNVSNAANNGFYSSPNLDHYFNEYNRIGRALNFLSEARSAHHLAKKISYYVLVLECLFAGDEKIEIQHKICERIAKYIGEDAAEQLKIYTDIKAYYSIRSSYVHGSEMPKKYNTKEKLIPFSVNIDNLIRKILIKVLQHDKDIFLSSSEKLNDWFLTLMFSPTLNKENTTEDTQSE